MRCITLVSEARILEMYIDSFGKRVDVDSCANPIRELLSPGDECTSLIYMILKYLSGTKNHNWEVQCESIMSVPSVVLLNSSW